ncbi:sulfotransferase [Pelagibius sp.]|uniref:sulfotransferase n=1 Tax=Pelagibius sp. TaxID=1931238 RepID=UPI00261DF8A6|nr:sulfotransferase [Pelagibius sp.]
MTPESLPPILAHSARLRAVIDAISDYTGPERDETPENDEAPVFILASGFRSGSTLVQRLIMSGGVLVWGEPFMETGWLHALASSLTWLPGRLHEKADFERLSESGPLEDQWVANLHPGVQRFRQAHRAMIAAFLATPAHEAAQEAGRSRWGAKFVRLDGNFAYYLRWLFPNARFVFCLRDPMAAFQSYRRNVGNYAAHPQDSGWVLTPTWRINSAERFFAMTHHLMGSLIAAAAESPETVILLRFEELVGDGAALAEMEERLQLRMDARVLDRKLGGGMRKRSAKAPLTDEERSAIERWRPRFEAFGYGAEA